MTRINRLLKLNKFGGQKLQSKNLNLCDVLINFLIIL